MKTNKESKQTVIQMYSKNKGINSETISRKHSQNNISVFQRFISSNKKIENDDQLYYKLNQKMDITNQVSPKKRLSLQNQYFTNGISNNNDQKYQHGSYMNNGNEISSQIQNTIQSNSFQTPVIQKQSLQNQESKSKQKINSAQQSDQYSRFSTPTPKYSSLHLERDSATPLVKEKQNPSQTRFQAMSNPQELLFQNVQDQLQSDKLNKDLIHLPSLNNDKSYPNTQRKSGFQVSSNGNGNQNLNQSQVLSVDKYSVPQRHTSSNLSRKSHLLAQNSDPIQLQSQNQDQDETTYQLKQNKAIIQPLSNIIDNTRKSKVIQRKSESEYELNQVFVKYNGLKPIQTTEKYLKQNNSLSMKDNTNGHYMQQKDYLTKSIQNIQPFNEVMEFQQGGDKNNQSYSQQNNNLFYSHAKLQQGSNSQQSISTQLTPLIKSQAKQLNPISQIKQSINYNNSINHSTNNNNNNFSIKTQTNLQPKTFQTSSVPISARESETKENKINESQNPPSSEFLGSYKGQFYDLKGNIKSFEVQSSVKTRAGQYSPNLRKINQDSSISIPGFPNDKSYSLFGVCDGHGEYGHLASAFVKKNLPKVVMRMIKSQGGWQNTDINLQKIITKSYSTVSTDLLNSKIDTFLSGTTVVTVLIHNNTLWCSNCGDSRAIIGRELGRGIKSEWKSIPLSEDHKPDLQREKKRIVEHGGRVEKSRDENGSTGGIYRVWNQTMEGPGLAMSRSFGDKAGRDVGVIADPDIYEILIKEEDKFIVIASDGVWEFLSNADVVKIVIPFYKANNPSGAADAIIKQSVCGWQKNDENVIDDITCVVLFFSFYDENKKKAIEYI